MKSSKNLKKAFLSFLILPFSAGFANTQKAQGSTTTTPVSSQSLAEGLMYQGPKLNEEAFNIQLGADYILWVINQEGLQAALNNAAVVPGTGESFVSVPGVGTAYTPKFKPRNGFKVHGDLVLSTYENVDLFLEYIWLDRSAPNSSSATDPNFTYPNLSVGPVVSGNNDTASETRNVNSVFKFEYNVLDFEIGRLSGIAKNIFTARPFWGIRGTWQTSYWDTTYQGTALDQDFQSSIVTSFVNVKQQTNGAGIRGGFDFGFNLCPNNDFVQNIFLTGTVALSGIYGPTTVTWNSGEKLTSSVTQVYQSTQEKFYRITPVVDLSLGLGWNYTFGGDNKDRYNAEIHLTWDTQSWINYGQYTSVSFFPTGGQNMTVQGLTVGGSLFF